MSTRRGATSSRVKVEAEEVEVAPASLSSLPPEIKLEIARCCWRNDLAARSTFDRRWRAHPYDDAARAAEWANWTGSDYEESEAEFTDSEAGAESDEASTSGESESGDDEDPSDAVAPFGFEQDTEWNLRLNSVVGLHRVNREWYKIGMQVRHKSLPMRLLYPGRVISFARDFLPRHGHHFRTINFPMTSGGAHISFETLLGLVPFMPSLNGLLLPYTVIPTPQPDLSLPIDLAQTPGLSPLLSHLFGQISRLFVKNATDPESLSTFVTLLEPFGLDKIKELELPGLMRSRTNRTDPPPATLATTVARFPSLERVVVSFGTSEENGNNAVGLVPRRARYGFIDDRTSIDSRELRTSIELYGGGQVVTEEYDNLCSLSNSTWSLTISSPSLMKDFDYCWAMRLSHLGLPLATSFPRLQVLVLSDIETRTDDQINKDNEHWTIPADFEGPRRNGHPTHPQDVVHRILPYLSPTGSYSDGTPHTLNDNLALYLLLLSSFDSSPLHTISLTGARLSFLLASPAFLPFLKGHLSTLKQLIIVSGDNSPDGAAHRRLAAFCDANDVRLAFEGTYSPRDPPIGEMKERMEEILKVARREGEKIMERGDHEALERLFAGVVEAERKA